MKVTNKKKQPKTGIRIIAEGNLFACDITLPENKVKEFCENIKKYILIGVTRQKV